MVNDNEDWRSFCYRTLRWDLSDWSVIYFYPKDFTFICPTEIVGMDVLVDEAKFNGISGTMSIVNGIGKHR